MELDRIYNADCLSVMRSISKETIDCIITDPPYRTTARGSAGNSGGMLQKDINKSGMVSENNDLKPSDYAADFFRLLKDGSHCYVMTNHVNLIEMLNTFEEVGFHFVKSLIWDKQNKIMGTFYMSQFEYILFFRKGFGKPINDCGTSDILSIPNKKSKDDSGENLHDTEKPVELMRILVRNSTNEGDVVLDPFMGIGSCGVACKQLGRNFIGCEINKQYYDVCEHRINGAQQPKRMKQLSLF